MVQTAKRIPSFDLLKVAALMYIIFGWHMDDYAGNILATSIGRTLVIGSLGIFIFVSGFTLTKSCREIVTVADVVRFMKKRFVRIYPLYLSSLVLSYVTSQISSKQFYAGVFLLNAVLNIHIKTLWFVTMIFVFYLLLPIILYKFSAVKTVLLTIVFISFCIIANNFAGLMDIRLTYYFPIFIWGVLCARYGNLFQLLKRKESIIFSVIILLVLTAMFDFMKNDWLKHVYVVGSLVFSISPMIALAELFAEKAESDVFVRLSYASFCMYLYHRIIFYALLQVYTPGTDMLKVLYLGVAGFPIIFITSERIQAGYDYLLSRTNVLVFSQR